MTHFGVIVSMLVGVMAILSGIFGFIWKASAKWQQLQDMLKYMNDKMLEIIAQKNGDHDNFDERIKHLERFDKGHK